MNSGIKHFYRTQLMSALNLNMIDHTLPIAAKVGVNEDRFDRWIDGLEVPSEHHVQQLAMVLGFPVGWFYSPPLEIAYCVEPIMMFDFPSPGAHRIDKDYVLQSFSDWTEYPPFEDLGLEPHPRVVESSSRNEGQEVLTELEVLLFGNVQGRSKETILTAIRERTHDPL